ncbi:type I restriction enzyme, S subunit [Candidatus Magnetomoraceae bacterium gMMP-13]
MMGGKYQAYPEYKDSGVEWLGRVPEYWEIKRLGQFFEERRDKVSDKEFPPLSVTMQGIVPQLETAAKTDAGDNRKLVLKNDFVINSRSDRKGASGVSAYCGSVSLISIVLTPKRIQPTFVHHLLRSYPFQEEFYRHGKGIVADLWSTNSSEMKNILIPDIPEDEQTQIANFLDYETAKIDTLIEKQQQLIKLLKEKRQAVISHAVTKGLNPDAPMRDSGVEWLGEVPEHWIVKPIKYLIALNPKKSEVHSKKSLTCNFVPMEKLKIGTVLLDEVRVISDVYDGYTYFKNDDILMAKVTPCFENKNIAIVRRLLNGVGFGSTEIYVLRVKKEAFNTFLFYRLQENNFMAIATAAMTGAGGLKRVPSDILNNYTMAIPNEEEQIQIANFLDSETAKINNLIQKSEAAIELMQKRRTALISAAVTGKIDVRNWQAPEQNQTNKNKEDGA